MSAVLTIGNVTDRFSSATEFDAQLRKRAGAVNHRIGARVDVDCLAIHAVTAARAVSLLIALDVSGALQVSNEIVLRNRLVDANLFGRGIDSRGTREHITAQQVVDPPGEHDPVIRQQRDHQAAGQHYGDDNVGFKEKP
jgi:hypothetical protein